MANLGSIKLVQPGVFSLTQAYVDVLGPGVGRPADTQVAEFRFYDTAGAVIAVIPAGSTVVLEDNAGGRFAAFDGGGTGKARFRLRHTAVVCDFEQADLSMAQSLPLRVKATINGVSVVQTFALKKRLTAITPTGDQTGNIKTYSNFSEFQGHWQSTGSNMTIQPTDGLVGGLRKSAFATEGPILKGANKTIKGSKDTFLNQRAGFLSGPVDNVIIEEMAMGVGTYDATPTALKELDNFSFGTKHPSAGTWSKNVAVRRGISFASNDENGRIKERCRRWHFKNWIFVYAQHPANHTKTNVHAFGPAVSDKAGYIYLEECILIGATRLAQIAKGVAGVVEVNCMSIGWMDSQAAIRFTPSASDWQHATPIEAIAEGNLLYLRSDTPAYRQGAIQFLSVDAAKSQVYVPQSGPMVNQFISHNKFTPDPVTVEGGGIEFKTCSGPDVLRTAPNFEYQGCARRPTSTEAEIRALFDRLTDPTIMGNGSKLCVDVLAKIRAGTIEPWLSPAQMEGLYGAPNAQGVPWVSGGSMGHGVV